MFYGVSSMSVGFTSKTHKNYQIITLDGDLDIYSAPSLKKDIHKLIDDGTLYLGIDMIHIKLLDSSGIALLANVQKRLRSEGGDLILLNVQPDVLVIFKLSSLDKFFKIISNEKDLP
jgi:anti-anti-sigma factor